MATVRLVVSTSNEFATLVSETLFNAGAQGLEERPGAKRTTTLVAYAETRRELASIWRRAEKALAGTPASAKADIEVDEAESWRTNWTEHLRPVALTPRLVLAPTTAEPPALGPKQRLVFYQPALAFGDGDHPTTRLASRAIEAHYRKQPGGALLDIGAGTGVLSFVAVLSGAKRALGTDIAPEALAAAQTNAAINGLSKSTRFIAAGARVSGSFDVVVVNIELRPLLQVLSRLPAAARRAPRLFITGFLASQLKDVTAAVKAAGFTPRSRQREGDWLLLAAENSA
jgi:ribosomal protein L11 methyltransferase